MFSPFSFSQNAKNSDSLKIQIENLKKMILHHEKNIIWCGEKLREIHLKIEQAGKDEGKLSFEEWTSLESARDVLHEIIVTIEENIKSLNLQLKDKMKDLFYEEHPEIKEMNQKKK